MIKKTSWTFLDFIQSTIVDGGPGIMAKIFGVFGTKTFSLIKENRTKNGLSRVRKTLALL